MVVSVVVAVEALAAVAVKVKTATDSQTGLEGVYRGGDSSVRGSKT